MAEFRAEYALAIAMVVALLAGIFTGYPVAFLLGGLGIAFAFIGDIPIPFLGTVGSRIFGGVIENWLMIAIPLFVFMGLMLERSGVAKRLLLTLQRLFGRTPGGLAISVAILGVVMAASTGIIGASVVMLGLLALPVMMKQGYRAEMACGVIAASGTLGILIPPSIMLVLMGSILQVSVGALFKAALMPGLLLGVLYIVYLLVIAWIKPDWAPLADPDAVDADTTPLPLALVRDLLGPVVLIVAVLGSIMAGIATPTEAAAIGAAGSLLLALAMRSLDWATLRSAVRETSRTSAMILFVVIGATCFSVVFKRLGGDYMIEEMITGTGLGPYGLLLLLMALIFVLGFFLEWIEISFVVLPLVAPVVELLDFGFGLSGQALLVWFAILVAINLQTSFLTPRSATRCSTSRASPRGRSALGPSIARSSPSWCCSSPDWRCASPSRRWCCGCRGFYNLYGWPGRFPIGISRRSSEQRLFTDSSSSGITPAASVLDQYIQNLIGAAHDS